MSIYKGKKREEIEKYINEQYDALQEYPWNEYPNYTNNLKEK